MPILILLALFLLALCVIYMLPTLWGLSIFSRYRGDRLVTCPETHDTAVVELDAKHAAVSGLAGQEKLRLESCSRWPERADCGQDCIAQALHDPIVLERPPVESHNPFRGIHHVAVLIAAAVSWMVGAFWYSERLFRPAWMRITGLSDSAERQRFDADSSAFTIAFVGALVFAYVLDWVIVRTGRPSIWRGAVEGLALGVAATLTPLFTVMAFEGKPAELFWIHGGYMLLACLLVGAIEGGWASWATRHSGALVHA
jgi:Protein of unknown function (DUF1761)